MGAVLTSVSLFTRSPSPLSVPLSSHLSLSPLSSASVHHSVTKMEDLLKAADIKKALEAFAATTFDHKKFFDMVGMKAMSAENVKKVFQTLDADESGFIEEEELKFVLKGFSPDGRDLTDEETKAFIDAADKDGDGKIGIEEFEALVHE